MMKNLKELNRGQYFFDSPPEKLSIIPWSHVTDVSITTQSHVFNSIIGSFKYFDHFPEYALWTWRSKFLKWANIYAWTLAGSSDQLYVPFKVDKEHIIDISKFTLPFVSSMIIHTQMWFCIDYYYPTLIDIMANFRPSIEKAYTCVWSLFDQVWAQQQLYIIHNQ